MLALADNFEASVGRVIDAVSTAATQMQSSAEAMSGTAKDTNHQSSVVARASEQAAINVQTVASAAEELATSVREVGRKVVQSTAIARQSVEEAQRTNEKVHGLAEAATRIGDVVTLINSIANPDQPLGAQCNDRGGARR